MSSSPTQTSDDTPDSIGNTLENTSASGVSDERLDSTSHRSEDEDLPEQPLSKSLSYKSQHAEVLLQNSSKFIAYSNEKVNGTYGIYHGKYVKRFDYLDANIDSTRYHISKIFLVDDKSMQETPWKSCITFGSIADKEIPPAIFCLKHKKGGSDDDYDVVFRRLNKTSVKEVLKEIQKINNDKNFVCLFDLYLVSSNANFQRLCLRVAKKIGDKSIQYTVCFDDHVDNDENMNDGDKVCAHLVNCPIGYLPTQCILNLAKVSV
ncbi:hypothetical protein TrispH2_008893 [Trichoplax sp. H2]|nr:hypothetical protein TrispH2_008893 [Trichoplax sp. H2]|eukprot:RDD39292.1 hypothetical protein TrispH2_008893 [Trichoplax sp. H2]